MFACNMLRFYFFAENDFINSLIRSDTQNGQVSLCFCFLAVNLGEIALADKDFLGLLYLAPCTLRFWFRGQQFWKLLK